MFGWQSVGVTFGDAVGTRRASGMQRLSWAALPMAALALACSSEGSSASQPHGDAGIVETVAPESSVATSGPGSTTLGPSAVESSMPTGGSSAASPQAPSSGFEGETSEPPSTSDGVDTSDGTPSGPLGSEPGDTSGSAIPSAVAFAPTGGGFDGTCVVELSASNGETMHYTLDGTVPTLDSPVYDGPITLDSTAMVRVVISDSDVLSYFSQTYVHVEADVADFSSDLPLVVIERHRDTPIERYGDELRPSSVLVFEPGVDGRSHVLGPATLSHRAGARVRGAYSRAFPQVGYAIETWEAGADIDEDVPFLGMPADSDWVLSAPSEMDRALMRNMFVMDLSRTIGRYAPRTQFVEVFLVDSQQRDSLAAEDYLGVYTAMEKIKRGKDRVDVAKLEETDVAGAELTGGYMFRIDHGENDFTAGGYQFGWVYPDADEMVLSARGPQVEYVRGYLDGFFGCLDENGFVNPTTLKHYSEYIDVPAWIDHHLINMLTKNVDGLRLSSYFYKDRDALLVAGPVWDFDRSMGTPHDGRAVQPNEWSTGDGTDHPSWGFWGQLFEDPDFAAAYWSRWDELREGAFTEQALVAMIDGYEARLTEARARHFEHWTQLPPDESAAHEVEIIREWLGERLIWVDGQRP